MHQSIVLLAFILLAILVVNYPNLIKLIGNRENRKGLYLFSIKIAYIIAIFFFSLFVYVLFFYLINELGENIFLILIFPLLLLIIGIFINNKKGEKENSIGTFFIDILIASNWLIFYTFFIAVLIEYSEGEKIGIKEAVFVILYLIISISSHYTLKKLKWLYGGIFMGLISILYCILSGYFFLL